MDEDKRDISPPPVQVILCLWGCPRQERIFFSAAEMASIRKASATGKMRTSGRTAETRQKRLPMELQTKALKPPQTANNRQAPKIRARQPSTATAASPGPKSGLKV